MLSLESPALLLLGGLVLACCSSCDGFLLRHGLDFNSEHLPSIALAPKDYDIRHRVGSSRSCRLLVAFSPSSSSTFLDSAVSAKDLELQSQQLVESLLQKISQAGTDGTKIPQNQREDINQIVEQIENLMANDTKSSTLNMTTVPLDGTHELLYTDTPNTPQYIGPIKGRTTQKFINETTFQNILQAGPLQIKLTAERTIMDDSRIKLFFKGFDVIIFGAKVLQKKIDAKGVWKMVFVGEVENKYDISKTKPKESKILLRVMKTPNLYILAKYL